MRFLPLIVFALFPLSIWAQSGVVGDKSKMVYWASECPEARLVSLADTVSFPTASDAEAKGYKKAETCTPANKLLIGGALPVKSETKTVGEIVSEGASLSRVKLNFRQYRMALMKVTGTMAVADYFAGPYAGRKRDFYGFIMEDSRGGTGFFYTRKTATGEDAFSRVTDPLLRGKQIAECEVRVEGIDRASALYGSLIKCKFWTIED